MLVHEVDDLFLGVIKAGHNGGGSGHSLLWEQSVGLEMKVSFLSLDLGILVFMEFVVLYFFSFGI